MSSRTSSRLVHILISKSILEALLISGVCVVAYFATINPYVRGWLDQADRATISGWVVDEANPSRRVEVQLFIDGKFAADRVASDFRPDVRAAKRSDDDWHGFVFSTPALADGRHEARIYAVHTSANGARQTLQLIGKPLRF